MYSVRNVGQVANLSNSQLALIQAPVERKIFLEGPAGVGKTSAGVGRLLHLLDAGVPDRSILVLAPQRTLAAPYTDALRRPTVRAGGQVTVFTVGGLAQRMVDLFWPLIAQEAGFAHPDRPPTFLTLETAQYYMARLVRPLLDRGYFETVVIDRNRLYSQIIDNLNKAAVVGFPHTEIGERLKAAWEGERSQARIYDEAQACATRFRQYCLAHNLLDFSLQVEVFVKYLWSTPAPPGRTSPAPPVYGGAHGQDNLAPSVPGGAQTLCRDYLLETYTHLIVENVEEDTPVAHDLLREWLPHCRSALVICDRQAGYRRFLGADPESARALGDLCDERVTFLDSVVTAPDLQALGARLARSLNRTLPGARGQGSKGPETGDARAALAFAYHRFHPQMLDWVAGEISTLVHDQGVSPGEIVVLAPFLTDALRFSLVNRLERKDVPARSHRPSRALRDEPATRCLLTLAAIAHPHWGICPSRFDVAYALMQAIDGIDLVRAQLLADIVYRVREGAPGLSSFDRINPEMQERLTFMLGGRYERLRVWLEAYVAGSQNTFPAVHEGGAVEQAPRPAAKGEPVPFDHFLSRLFGEVLSQEGGGFHRDYDAGRVAHDLIESVRKFRWVASESLVAESADVASVDAPSVDEVSVVGGPDPSVDAPSVDATSIGKGPGLSADAAPAVEGKPLGQEYIEMVQDGVIAAQYVRSWRLQPGDVVLLAPAYTFLMSNRPVDYQFWLNVGGRGWWERLYQPLTHPYVLSRHWPRDAVWTDADEHETRQEALYRLAQGLIRRCRRKVYLGLSELGEQGNEQKGPLLQAIQRVLRHLPAEAEE